MLSLPIMVSPMLILVILKIHVIIPREHLAHGFGRGSYQGGNSPLRNEIAHDDISALDASASASPCEENSLQVASQDEFSKSESLLNSPLIFAGQLRCSKALSRPIVDLNELYLKLGYGKKKDLRPIVLKNYSLPQIVTWREGTYRLFLKGGLLLLSFPLT